MRGAVKLWRCDDVARLVATIGHVRQSIEQGRLPRRGGQRGDAAFQLGHALFQHRHGGIGNAAVAKAFFFQVEQGRAMVGAVKGKGRRLVDGHRHRVGGRVMVEARMDGNGFGAHELT